MLSLKSNRAPVYRLADGRKDLRGPGPSPWSIERTELLKKLWELGLSAKDIARQINEETGGELTRNAILGKVHRLDLSLRDHHWQYRFVTPEQMRERKRKREATFRAKRRGLFVVPPPATDSEIPTEQRRQLLELQNHHCRWPVGEPGKPGFFFCGAEDADLLGGRSYCASHQFLAWRRSAA